jgi:hypothetical protein
VRELDRERERFFPDDVVPLPLLRDLPRLPTFVVVLSFVSHDFESIEDAADSIEVVDVVDDERAKASTFGDRDADLARVRLFCLGRRPLLLLLLSSLLLFLV